MKEKTRAVLTAPVYHDVGVETLTPDVHVTVITRNVRDEVEDA